MSHAKIVRYGANEIVELVTGKPLLLQDLGRTIDERRARIQAATAPEFATSGA